jgi:hypothetical protein
MSKIIVIFTYNLKANIMTTLLDMFQELNSFVNCSQYFDAAGRSSINTESSPRLKGLVREWIDGEYDECPELLAQRLAGLLS